ATPCAASRPAPRRRGGRPAPSRGGPPGRRRRPDEEERGERSTTDLAPAVSGLPVRRRVRPLPGQRRRLVSVGDAGGDLTALAGDAYCPSMTARVRPPAARGRPLSRRR